MKNQMILLLALLSVTGCVQENKQPAAVTTTSLPPETVTSTAETPQTTSDLATTEPATSTTAPADYSEVHIWGMISAENTAGPYVLSLEADRFDPDAIRYEKIISSVGSANYAGDVSVYFNADKKQAILVNRGTYPVHDVLAIAPTKNNRFLGKYIYSDVVPDLSAGQEITVPLRERKTGYNLTDELKKQGFTEKEATEFSGIWARSLPTPKDGGGILSYRISKEEGEKILANINIEPAPAKTLRSLYALLILTGRADSQMPVIGAGFGIYYGQELVISEEDILYYNRTSHEIKLAPAGLMKLRSRVPYEEEKGQLVPKLGGLYLKTFTVRLDGQELYSGTFWSSVSSQSNEGVVLLDVLTIVSDDSIKLQAGYPTSEYFKGADPRDNAQLFEYLKSKDKLVE